MKNNPATIFDGLHGKDVILICPRCGERHYPRCEPLTVAEAGSKGGQSRSEAKKSAARANGKNGGRPKTKKK